MAKKIKRKRWAARVREVRLYDTTYIVWAADEHEAEAKMLMGDTVGECLGRLDKVIGRSVAPYEHIQPLGSDGTR